MKTCLPVKLGLMIVYTALGICCKKKKDKEYAVFHPSINKEIMQADTGDTCSSLTSVTLIVYELD